MCFYLFILYVYILYVLYVLYVYILYFLYFIYLIYVVQRYKIFKIVNKIWGNLSKVLINSLNFIKTFLDRLMIRFLSKFIDNVFKLSLRNRT